MNGEEKKGWRALIGDRAFYRVVLAVALPIILQNGITNFVSLLDNLMVGRVGTDQMSGVAIANQLMFVYNLTLFGAISGAGIFGAQFFGKGDIEGFRYTFRFKLIVCLLIFALGACIFGLFDRQLISLYLKEGEVGDVEATLAYGRSYLRIMLSGMLPFCIVQVYAGSLREMGKTVLPMTAGVCAMVTNCVLNYILIFGKFGAPALGVDGAAIATVVSRFVEMVIVVGWTHAKRQENAFIKGAYRSLYIPGKLVRSIVITGFPLLLNESLWSAGMAVLNQQYAQRGIEYVSSMNISSTVYNLFSIFFISMGSVVSILVGQQLGRGDLKKTKEMANQLIAFSVGICTVVCVGMLLISEAFPALYNTEPLIRELAARFIRISAWAMPMQAFLNAAYFTLRSGGKTWITFLFDSVYVWGVSIPLCALLVRFTALPTVSVYAIVTYADLIKCVIGFILVKRGTWLKNMVKES